MSDDDDDDIRKLLRDADPDVEYPKDLYTATKAEYDTRVRTNQPDDKKGCPLMIMTFIFRLCFCVLFAAAVWYVFWG